MTATVDTPAETWQEQEIVVVPGIAMRAEAGRARQLPFALTIFLSAFLLFQVQLLLGKGILPLFGGAPAVWTACVLVFQLLFLAGYGYSHGLASWIPLRRQILVHGILLAISAVYLALLGYVRATPIGPVANWRPQPMANPTWTIIEYLISAIGPPFFLLSATRPLMQHWFAQGAPKRSPYRLYALSNAGSLVGLLTYPFLLEWLFTIRHQAWLWSSGYLLFTALCATIALRLPRQASEGPAVTPEEHTVSGRPKAIRFLLWLAFSSCSTVILLSSTNFLCENIAPIPLLWVLPLTLYLLTFMMAFASPRWYSRRVFWPLYALAIGIAVSPNITPQRSAPAILIALYCFTIFVVCMVCHGELARSKP